MANKKKRGKTPQQHPWPLPTAEVYDVQRRGGKIVIKGIKREPMWFETADGKKRVLDHPFTEKELLDLSRGLLSYGPGSDMPQRLFQGLFFNIQWQLNQLPWTSDRVHQWRWGQLRYRLDRDGKEGRQKQGRKRLEKEVADLSQTTPAAGDEDTIRKSFDLIEKTLPPAKRRAILAAQEMVASALGKNSPDFP